METFAFFPSENKDRVVSSSQLANFLSQLFTNGVFDNGLKVEKGEGMSVIIKEGYALINGHFYHNDEDLKLEIPSPNPSLNRMDNIVVRLSEEDRSIHAFVTTGVPSSSASAPPLTRDLETYEIRLATVTVNKGTSAIETTMITDTRFNTSDCGNVVAAVQHIDTTEVFNQYEAYFNEWFEELKITLDENIAAKLQTEILDIKKRLDTLENNQILYGTCTEEEFQAAMEKSS